MRLMPRIRHLLTPVIDFLYPPLCLGCGAPIHVDDVLCSICMTQLLPLPLCSAQSPRYLAEMNMHPDVALIAAAYEYEIGGVLEACIHAMKYRRLYRIAVWLGRLAGERLADSPHVAGDPVLLPVPLHRLKLIERGYNQAEHVCRGIAMETGLEVETHVLVRERYTRSQAAGKLDRSTRGDNMRGAFTVDEAVLARYAGRPCVVVDDLITTGATAAECCAALFRAGCGDVRVVAVAHPSRADAET